MHNTFGDLDLVYNTFLDMDMVHNTLVDMDMVHNTHLQIWCITHSTYLLHNTLTNVVQSQGDGSKERS